MQHFNEIVLFATLNSSIVPCKYYFFVLKRVPGVFSLLVLMVFSRLHCLWIPSLFILFESTVIVLPLRIRFKIRFVLIKTHNWKRSSEMNTKDEGEILFQAILHCTVHTPHNVQRIQHHHTRTGPGHAHAAHWWLGDKAKTILSTARYQRAFGRSVWGRAAWRHRTHFIIYLNCWSGE